MNLGILTFFNAHNYGAVLQAYALKTYLESTGNHVRIINYRNKSIDKAYPKVLLPRIGKKDIFSPSSWFNTLAELERCFFSWKDWRTQYRKFELFISEELQVSCDINWEQQIQDMEVIFFGSDQIWEKNITGKAEKIYYGGFETDARKISYAASCYSETSCIDEELIAKLHDFSMISVREQKLADLLQANLRDKHIYNVVDPVFLLSSEEYLQLINASPCKRNYILFYYVSEDDELRAISDYVRLKESREVIEIHYYKTKAVSEAWQRADAGPLDFLNLFYYADEVYTNSFHGVAFSLIFRKKFWALNQNMRIVNVLSEFHMEERNLLGFSDWMKKREWDIDFSECEVLMENMISLSKRFIKEALQGE